MNSYIADSEKLSKYVPVYEIERKIRRILLLFLTLIPLALGCVNFILKQYQVAGVYLLVSFAGIIPQFILKGISEELISNYTGGMFFPTVIVSAIFSHFPSDSAGFSIYLVALLLWQILYFGISKIYIFLVFNITIYIIFEIFEIFDFYDYALLTPVDNSAFYLELLDFIPYVLCLSGLLMLARKFNIYFQVLSGAIEKSDNMARRESSFLSRISHEIRNPLNGMLGLIEAAKEDAPPDIKEQLWLAERTGEQLLDVLNEVLEFKKLENRNAVNTPESFNTHEMSKVIGAIFGNLATGKNIQLESKSDFTRLPHWIIADKKRIAQIVTNLLSNAIKFTPVYGKISIESKYDATSGIWSIEVIDNGPGMSKVTLDALFKPFSQGELSDHMSSQGSGLGLMIARQLAEEMGGRISVRSELGRGSAFTFYFPAAVSPGIEKAGSVQEFPQSTPAESPVKIDLTGRSILCVDDSEANLRVITRPLEKAGAIVYAMADPNMALMIAEDTDLDLVITDISMPEMTGEDLLREIRKIKPDLPVLAITGHVLDEEKARFLADGFRDVISKPVSSRRLCEIVVFSLAF